MEIEKSYYVRCRVGEKGLEGVFVIKLFCVEESFYKFLCACVEWRGVVKDI